MSCPDQPENPAILAGWRHPTARWPKRVALVSLGVTHQDFVAEWLGRDPADTVWGRDETWTLNRGALVFRHDLAFVMDHLDGERQAWPRYGEALWNHYRPIITSVAPDWPAHVTAYPQEAIRRHFGPGHDYFANSLGWIIAYAIWIGVRELTLWGCDYHHEQSQAREDDRANCEYWVAIARERGMAVLYPETSTLCNANLGRRHYGYPEPLPPL